MRHIRKASTTFTLVLLLLASLPLSAATIRVPADQPTIQAGIDAAVDGDTVLVAPGTHTGDGNRDMSFNGKAITVRSEYGPDTCLIDCEGDWANLHRAFSFNNGEGRGSVLEGFAIERGYMQTSSTEGEPGGSLLIENASPTIRNNAFYRHSASGDESRHGGGGTIACFGDSSPLIIRNSFRSSFAQGYYCSGGGIACIDSSPVIVNNLFYGCSTSGWGGAVFVSGGSPVIANCTVYSCYAKDGGSAICVLTGQAEITNCILWNTGAAGTDDNVIQVGHDSGEALATIHHSCVELGQDAVTIVGSGELTWGDGMLETDPDFREGPAGDFYLAQVAAGQATDSDCVDAGDPLSDTVEGSTRTDMVQDTGVVDMGWHYPIPRSAARLVTGPGPSQGNPPRVHVFLPAQDELAVEQFPAYGADSWGVNVACGRVTDPDFDQIITGPGPGGIYGPQVRGFLVDGNPVPQVNFLAYGTNKYGTNVAAGDMDGDGYDEIVTGAGPGAVFGPHTRGWNVDGETATAMPGVSFFAYGTLKYGVNVAAGDLDGDGYDEIVTGAGPGAVFGPHVRGWNVDGGSAAAMPGVNFFAYGTLKYGVNVACGDVDGDGIDEILTAPGPSVAFASHIRGWNIDSGSSVPLDGCNFFAWSPVLPRFGARVASGTDLDGDGRHEIVVGAGPDPSIGSPVRVFDYLDGTVTQDFSLEAYPSGWNHGVKVATGVFE